MSGGSSNQGSQIQSSMPWKPAQKPLKDVMGKAENLYDNKKGFGVYGGDWSVGPDADTNQALNRMSALAGRGNGLAGNQMGLSSALMGGQHDPDQSKYQAMYGQAGQFADNARSGIQGLMGRTNNDAFNAALDTQIGKLGDDVTRQFGGSSFGAGSHAGMLGDVLGEARTSAMANNFYNQANLERGLMGDLSGVDQNLLGQRAGLAGAMTNAGQLGVQNRLAGQGFADRAYNSQYLPYERQAQVGATREGYDASQLQGDMNRYNARQASPWDRLNAYSGLIGGASQGYGTQTSNVSTPSNPWGSAAGGALLGGQAMGPLGAAGGGLLGFLQGL